MIGLVVYLGFCLLLILAFCQAATFGDRGDMSMSVRAKFKVQSIQDSGDSEGKVYSRRVVLTPVYSNDPTHENRSFWHATPSGSIDMWINNPAAFEQFEEGVEYYIDFTPADDGPR